MYSFRAEVWLYQGAAAWHFLTLPPDVSDEIEATASRPEPAFGSVKVIATVGSTTWSTSIFPSKEDGGYVLPLKKAVRETEGIAAGDTVKVRLEIADP